MAHMQYDLCFPSMPAMEERILQHIRQAQEPSDLDAFGTFVNMQLETELLHKWYRTNMLRQIENRLRAEYKKEKNKGLRLRLKTAIRQLEKVGLPASLP